MNKLEQARIHIDEIDKQMAILFKERMLAVSDVLDFKIENHLPVLDQVRENAMILKNKQRFDNPDLESYYEQFLKAILEISRKYQEDHYE